MGTMGMVIRRGLGELGPFLFVLLLRREERREYGVLGPRPPARPAAIRDERRQHLEAEGELVLVAALR